MSRISIILGSVLILIGAGDFLGAKVPDSTALTPAALGAAMILLGWTSRIRQYARRSIIFAAVLAVLGFFGAGLRVLTVLLGEGPAINNSSLTLEIAMSLICAAYVGLSVKYLYENRGLKGSTEKN